MIINNIDLNVNEFEIENNNNITIIITHGLAEYSKSYFETAKDFNKLGFNVITYDIRGHGKSLGERGSVGSYKDFINDLDGLVDYAYSKTKKVYLIAHSMGGLITNIYTSLYNKTDGVIITSSPTYQLKELMVFKIIPNFLINKYKIKTNFKDKKLNHFNNYQKDNYDLDYIEFKLINEVLIKGMKVLNKNFKNYNTDVLFIYSKSDQMATVNYGKHIYDRISSKNKKLLIYEESYHNIFTDVERDKLIKDISDWIIANENR